jgi:hypothetical protein
MDGGQGPQTNPVLRLRPANQFPLGIPHRDHQRHGIDQGAGCPLTRKADHRAIEVMRSDIPMVEDRRNLDEALRPMQEKRLPAVGITDRAGRLVGLVTPENIGEMMMVQAAHPKRRAGTPWRPEAPRTSI